MVAGKEAALAAVRRGFGSQRPITVLPDSSLGNASGVWRPSALFICAKKPGTLLKWNSMLSWAVSFAVWKTKTNWFLVQPRSLSGWTEGGSFVACTKEESDAWQAGRFLIITALEERILEKTAEDAPPVSDVVPNAIWGKHIST